MTRPPTAGWSSLWQTRRVASSAVLVAVSDTGDPTGTWTRYSIDADGPNLVWADFPIVGLNDQWVVITLNMFANADDAFAGSDTYVMDRLALYDGTLTTVNVFTEAVGRRRAHDLQRRQRRHYVSRP